MTPAVELDKSFGTNVGSCGNIQIRVVVLKPKPKPKPDAKATEPETSVTGDDEPLLDTGGASPLSAYLERKSHGKQCVVFLVNGQRHDAWDNSFIVRHLSFKYLRTRTMIIVDLDGLAHEAISEIVQGSRHGLYEGNVLGAISDRMIATLKKDPDLMRLQTEAEQDIAELQAGDEVVRQKLDELIDAHHTAATHIDAGSAEPGPTRADDPVSFGKDKRQDVVVESPPDVGDAGTFPVLVTNPPSTTIRLRPDVERLLQVRAVPEPAWAKLETFDIRTQPLIEELNVTTIRTVTGAHIRLNFEEPDGFDTDEYPFVTTLTAFAKFKGHPELRLVEREIVINRPGPPPPKPKPTLRVNPTFLRVVSRQPIKLVAGGPSAHVRMAWDGHDSLTVGTAPPWTFRARCLTIGTFPPIGFSEPHNGRFELLLDTPHGLLPEQRLDFEVEALGPSGQRLLTTFVGEVSEQPPAPEPRRITAKAPEAAAQRRPPYELKYVHEAEWGKPTCWGEMEWTKDDAGAFTEPTESAPLTLIINEDAEGLKEFREALVNRNLDELTVKERVTRYTTHIAFHLYQMYRFTETQRKASDVDEAVRVPTDDERRQEIGRVATTLLKIMR